MQPSADKSLPQKQSRCHAPCRSRWNRRLSRNRVDSRGNQPPERRSTTDTWHTSDPSLDKLPPSDTPSLRTSLVFSRRPCVRKGGTFMRFLSRRLVCPGGNTHRGRRRIGKSSLIEEFARRSKCRFFELVGAAPQPKMTNADQLTNFNSMTKMPRRRKTVCGI